MEVYENKLAKIIELSLSLAESSKDLLRSNALEGDIQDRQQLIIQELANYAPWFKIFKKNIAKEKDSEIGFLHAFEAQLSFFYKNNDTYIQHTNIKKSILKAEIKQIQKTKKILNNLSKSYGCEDLLRKKASSKVSRATRYTVNTLS